MNWETSKNWLIAVFFILDLILGWQFWQSRLITRGYTESRADIIANTKTLLAQQNFILKAPIPTEQPNLTSLQATTANIPIQKLAHDVFPNAKHMTVQPQSGAAVTSAGKVEINQKGTWTVTLRPSLEVQDPQDLLSIVWKGSSYQMDDTLTNISKSWTFNETYDGLPMFDSSLTAVQSGNKVTTYQQTLYNSPKAVGTPKPIISSLDALNSLANTVDKSVERQDNIIEGIDLGYALKSPGTVSSGSISSNYWFPVWRIVTINNVYYVNAFTGEIETE